MARRLDDLKMLNTDRWNRHTMSQSRNEGTGADAAAGGGASGGGDSEQLLSHPDAVPTGGSLFNLPNPTNDGEFVKPDDDEVGPEGLQR